jgi:hypothetical protein
MVEFFYQNRLGEGKSCIFRILYIQSTISLRNQKLNHCIEMFLVSSASFFRLLFFIQSYFFLSFFFFFFFVGGGGFAVGVYPN